MPNLYRDYKPLRNYLREYNLASGLRACYHFMQYLSMKRPLPPQFYNPLLATREKQLRTSVFPWEIEILLREIIINCTEIGGKKFKDWNSISRPINLIKNIGNLAFANHNSQKDDVLFEIIRIAHRQFPWQIGINRHDLSKYFELYNNKYLYRRIYDIFGIEVRELFQLTLSLAGHFVNEPILTYPIENQLNSVNDGVFIDLIKKFSISFDTLKKKTIENQRYDVNWAYTSNPLRHHPIIDFDGKILICPIVDFLIRRVSSGIYYDLLDVPNVAGRFLGPAVQEIIGKIARSEIKGMRMLAERDYRGKKNRKDTIDWIISDESAHIFIEVKSARIKQSGINDLFDTEASVAQLRRLSNFGVQAYSTLSDALSGDYPHWKPDGLPVYLMVVTLEDWHTVGIQVQREVVEPIRERLSEKGLSPRLPDDFPFIYASSADLGAMLHVANKVSLETVLNKKTSGEFMQWQLGVFLQTAFQDEIQGYRPSAFDPAWNEIV